MWTKASAAPETPERPIEGVVLVKGGREKRKATVKQRKARRDGILSKRKTKEKRVKKKSKMKKMRKTVSISWRRSHSSSINACMWLCAGRSALCLYHGWAADDGGQGVCRAETSTITSP
jgi:hypothetical protein